ncbi:MAG: hypothetical protein AB8I08_34870 [Sandaracinaceae bacterium]
MLIPFGVMDDDLGLAIGGSVTAGVGAALVGVGLAGVALNPHVVRPGAGVTFPLK